MGGENFLMRGEEGEARPGTNWKQGYQRESGFRLNPVLARRAARSSCCESEPVLSAGPIPPSVSARVRTSRVQGPSRWLLETLRSSWMCFW